jgi:uncharacterized protein with HEPN domain
LRRLPAQSRRSKRRRSCGGVHVQAAPQCQETQKISVTAS